MDLLTAAEVLNLARREDAIFVVKVSLFANKASHVCEAIIDESRDKGLVTAEELGVCLLYQRHPQFLRVHTFPED